MLLSALIVREKRVPPATAHSSKTVQTVVSQDDCVCPCPTNTNRISRLTLAVIPENTPNTADELPLIDYAAANPPQSGISVIDPGSAPFAIVDMKRILIAHQSDASLPVGKSNLLAHIKRTTATRARLHHLEFVFDSSDQTLNGTPAFINPTNGALDITDEILKDMSQ